MLAIAKGINVFHPRSINWSYRKRGSVQRTHMKKKMKKNIFANNATTPNMVTQFSDKPRWCIYGKL